MEAPPPIIRPQSALNERETMETEVISSCYCFDLFWILYTDRACRRVAY